MGGNAHEWSARGDLPTNSFITWPFHLPFLFLPPQLLTQMKIFRFELKKKQLSFPILLPEVQCQAFHSLLWLLFCTTPHFLKHIHFRSILTPSGSPVFTRVTLRMFTLPYSVRSLWLITNCHSSLEHTSSASLLICYTHLVEPHSWLNSTLSTLYLHSGSWRWLEEKRVSAE